MCFKRTFVIIFILFVTLIVLIIPVFANSASHTITVTIAEICRYRIEDVVVRQNGDELLQEVSVAVLSNSARSWKFKAYPEAVPENVEWSKDGESWQKLERNSNTILKGTKTMWNKYRIFYRYPSHFQSEININYQLMLEE